MTPAHDPDNEFDAYQHVPRVITAMARDDATGSYIKPHRHPRGQLLYASNGLMRAATETGLWFIPPQRGLWIPAGIEHDQLMLSPVTMRTLYIEQSVAATLGDQCRVVEVSVLLRELIMALAAQPIEYELEGRNSHIVELILCELRTIRTVALELPWPKDRRVLRICEAIFETPGQSWGLDHWAETVGTSPRNLIRLFQKETGLSYRHWVQQARLAVALTRLENGESVANVAQDLGYASPSAFTAMFRTVLGETPTEYLNRRSQP
jgi:AraC-like DNA-binding protein